MVEVEVVELAVVVVVVMVLATLLAPLTSLPLDQNIRTTPGNNLTPYLKSEPYTITRQPSLLISLFVS